MCFMKIFTLDYLLGIFKLQIKDNGKYGRNKQRRTKKVALGLDVVNEETPAGGVVPKPPSLSKRDSNQLGLGGSKPSKPQGNSLSTGNNEGIQSGDENDNEDPLQEEPRSSSSSSTVSSSSSSELPKSTETNKNKRKMNNNTPY